MKKTRDVINEGIYCRKDKGQNPTVNTEKFTSYVNVAIIYVSVKRLSQRLSMQAMGPLKLLQNR